MEDPYAPNPSDDSRQGAYAALTTSSMTSGTPRNSSDSSVYRLAAEAAARSVALMRTPVTVAMVSSGALVNLLGAVLFALLPSRDSADLSVWLVLARGAWTTYAMTLGTFVVCAVLAFATMKRGDDRGGGGGGTRTPSAALNHPRAERAPLPSGLTAAFLARAALPAGLDILVTGAQLAALALVDPALVGILKTALQVLVVAVVDGFSKRAPNQRQTLALGGIAVGIGVCVFRDVWRPPTTDDDDDFGGSPRRSQLPGLALVAASGLLGGTRNVVEGAILRDQPALPGGGQALLLAESALSAALLVVLAPPLWAVLQFGTVAGGGLASSEPSGGAGGAAVALLILIGFLAASYGKDAGKFFLVAQDGSALRAKLLALLFPFGTWALDLGIYGLGGRRHAPPLGVGWATDASLVQLAGFLLILTCNVLYVDSKTGAG